MRVNRFLGGAKKAAFALFAVAMVLVLAGCGKDGKIYGVLDWDYTPILYSSVGGFPSYSYSGVYYEISPGTYSYQYIESDGTYYYPSYYVNGGHDSTLYYMGTYKVEADPGTLLFVDGKDHNFELYLGYNGLYKYGDVRSAPQALGTRSWSQDGLRITVTTSVVQLTPEDAAKLPKVEFKK